MDKGFLLEPPITRWICKFCNFRDVTREARIHTRMHDCPGMGGLSTPMLDESMKVDLVVNEREDYVGKDLVQTDAEGRAIMSIKTIREDGEDCVVYAPTATGSVE